MIRYEVPQQWIRYDFQAIAEAFIEAKAAVLALREIPYQKGWVERLQQMELKREVAGTSRIEGAIFTEKELDQAIKETAQQLATRSQRQAAAAHSTYRWIAGLPHDRALDGELVREIHTRMVTGADDDHCAPGELRQRDQNVNFGAPSHRGAEGGDEVKQAFDQLMLAVATDYKHHDPIIQALAVHYHLAAMHPYLDGNGRTARAVEALMLQRSGLRDSCFIAMSNYYYEEKTNYLTSLAAVRRDDFDLTPFLTFALKGVYEQSRRLLQEIRHEVSREIYRNLMFDLFQRLQTPRKRVIRSRQLAILEFLLDQDDWVSTVELVKRSAGIYEGMKDYHRALGRDVNDLAALGAIEWERRDAIGAVELRVDLDWPAEITESGFVEMVKKMPRVKGPFAIS